VSGSAGLGLIFTILAAQTSQASDQNKLVSYGDGETFVTEECDEAIQRLTEITASNVKGNVSDEQKSKSSMDLLFSLPTMKLIKVQAAQLDIVCFVRW
jgi:hypothetical protein